MGTPLNIPPGVRDLPPSARLCYLAIRQGSALSIDELVAYTGASETTVHRSLSELREHGYIETVEHPTDWRRRQHRLPPTLASGNEVEA